MSVTGFMLMYIGAGTSVSYIRPELMSKAVDSFIPPLQKQAVIVLKQTLLPLAGYRPITNNE